MNKFRLFIILGFSLLLVGSLGQRHDAAYSQDETNEDCVALVTEAMRILGSACAEVGSNEACYGHTLVSATFREENVERQFLTSGDIVSIEALEALVTDPLNLDTGTWGIALMRLQADLPDSSMTLILMGDTQLTSAVDPNIAALPTCAVTNDSARNMNLRAGPGLNWEITGVLPAEETLVANGRDEEGDWVRVVRNGAFGWVYTPRMTIDCEVETLAVVDETAETSTIYSQPMQAFTLQSGTESMCQEAPNALLVESPSGQRAHIMVNGVELEFASAGILTADLNGDLVIAGLEGKIQVTALGHTFLVEPGLQTLVRLQNGLPIDIPEVPHPIINSALEGIPRDVLEDGLGDILDIDVGTIIDIPRLDEIPSIRPGDGDTDTPIDGVDIPSIDPIPGGDGGDIGVPPDGTLNPTCAVGSRVSGVYTAVNLSASSETFVLRLSDGIRYVSPGTMITVRSGETVADTVSLAITEPVSSEATAVSVEVTDVSPNVTVVVSGEVNCGVDDSDPDGLPTSD